MKIPLNLGNQGAHRPLDDGKIPESDIIACKNGDWEAKARLIHALMPMLMTLARQRSNDNAAINNYVDAGKQAIVRAARKYKPTGNSDKFQFLAIGLIEQSMDDIDKPAGFFARLFGRR